jgi:hypothetical protein
MNRIAFNKASQEALRRTNEHAPQAAQSDANFRALLQEMRSLPETPARIETESAKMKEFGAENQPALLATPLHEVVGRTIGNAEEPADPDRTLKPGSDVAPGFEVESDVSVFVQPGPDFQLLRGLELHTAPVRRVEVIPPLQLVLRQSAASSAAAPVEATEFDFNASNEWPRTSKPAHVHQCKSGCETPVPVEAGWFAQVSMHEKFITAPPVEGSQFNVEADFLARTAGWQTERANLDQRGADFAARQTPARNIPDRVGKQRPIGAGPLNGLLPLLPSGPAMRERTAASQSPELEPSANMLVVTPNGSPPHSIRRLRTATPAVPAGPDLLQAATESCASPHMPHSRSMAKSDHRKVNEAYIQPHAQRPQSRNLAETTLETNALFSESRPQDATAAAWAGAAANAIPAAHVTDYALATQMTVNTMPPHALNAQNITAEVARLAAELSEPHIFQNETEEIRAELQGRLKSVRIKLQPETLGEVCINVHSSPRGMRVEVRVQNDDAGNALLMEINAAASKLSAIGLALEQVTLTAPSGGITVVQSPAPQAGHFSLDNQGGHLRERETGENDSRSARSQKSQSDETSGATAAGLYI